jgi:hypothetical protein
MSQREVAITGGPNNTKAMVTGQEELLVKINSATASGLATEATLANIDSNVSTIASNAIDLATETTLSSVDTKLTAVVRTPAIKRYVNIPGTTQVGAYSFSIANVGTADGTVDGVIIPAGLTISYDGGALNNTLLDISFDATGTIFIVTYIS